VKMPRISVGALMTGLVVVAIDCVVYRSIRSRPEFLSGSLTLVVMATLPMANILSFVFAALIRGRAEARACRVGFVAGAGLAMVATIVWLMPALGGVEWLLTSTGLGRWLEASPTRLMAAYYGIVVGLPLLFQALAGLVGGWAGRWIGARRVHEPVVEATRPGRSRVASLGALVILAAVPALAVEGYMCRRVDPHLARLAVGTEAVVDLKNPAVGPLMVPKGSPIRRLAGTKVRVVADGEPYQVERVASSAHDKEYVRDHRPIRVTILDGPRAGEAITLTHCLIRAIR
jgi:hypothetical protein